MPFEIAVDSATDAAAAARFADRLEVCSHLALHGLTPPPALVRETRAAVDAHRVGTPIEIVALVRPTVDLVMSPRDVDAAEREIAESIEAGADTVAFGALDSSGRIDTVVCRQLLSACRGRRAVFHRAFDFAVDTREALEVLIDLGFARVLCAGVASFDHGARSLAQRLGALYALVEQSRGRIAIVACGGVRSTNVAEFAGVTGEVHSSCRSGGVFDAGEAGTIRALLSR